MPTGLIVASYISQITIMIMALITLLSKRELKKQLIIMSYYYLIAGITDIIGFFLIQYGQQTLSLYRIFNLAEFILLAYMFINIEKIFFIKIIMIVIWVMGTIIIWIGNIIQPGQSFTSFYMALSYLILFMMSLRSFYFTVVSKVNPIKDAQFWLTLGLSFFFTINSIAMLLWTAERFKIGATIFISVNIITNIIIMWSFKCIFKQPTLIL